MYVLFMNDEVCGYGTQADLRAFAERLHNKFTDAEFIIGEWNGERQKGKELTVYGGIEILKF